MECNSKMALHFVLWVNYRYSLLYQHYIGKACLRLHLQLFVLSQIVIEPSKVGDFRPDELHLGIVVQMP